jgi:hypothetical protein
MAPLLLRLLPPLAFLNTKAEASSTKPNKCALVNGYRPRAPSENNVGISISHV